MDSEARSSNSPKSLIRRAVVSFGAERRKAFRAYLSHQRCSPRISAHFMKIQKICKTCRHWKQYDTVNNTHGICAKMSWAYPGALDVIRVEKPKMPNQWDSGGVSLPVTGPHFGCIHWQS